MPRAVSTKTEGGSSSVSRATSRKPGIAFSRSSAAGARPPAEPLRRERMAYRPWNACDSQKPGLRMCGRSCSSGRSRSGSHRAARCGRSPSACRRVQLLDRARHRAQPGHMRAHRLGIEPAQPRVVRHQTGRARGRRVEVILQIQIGPAEIVNRRHAPRGGWISSSRSPLNDRLGSCCHGSPRRPRCCRARRRRASSGELRVPSHHRVAQPAVADRAPRSSDTLGPISLRSILTPSSM